LIKYKGKLKILPISLLLGGITTEKRKFISFAAERKPLNRSRFGSESSPNPFFGFCAQQNTAK